ncbi:MAG: tryptophan--tRNA ligase [Defluviitaleaceae bacterium]|nr:tryptophan--tRNA ligase [Defluviitaleaceae bacterium]
MKKIIFSGMQPTSVPQIGNYLGAIKNWNALQSQYNSLYCVVDLHAITIRQDPNELRQNSLNLLALYIAAGLDPDENIIYIQSHYNGHTELSWILSCFAYMGELGRMTQYKDKSSKHNENVNAGLFNYPVLMAADILLFGAHLVPVGDDQKQHLELARDIAIRFNNVYGDIFTVPEAYIPKSGARIMSLANPEKKMSKSDEAANQISLLDAPEAVMKKFKRAVTDSETEIRYDPESKPGISNLLEIYATTLGISIDKATAEFAGSGYGHLKTTVGQAVVDEIINPIQSKYSDLTKNKDYLHQIMQKNAAKAKELGDPILRKVKEAVGFIVGCVD